MINIIPQIQVVQLKKLRLYHVSIGFLVILYLRFKLSNQKTYFKLRERASFHWISLITMRTACAVVFI